MKTNVICCVFNRPDLLDFQIRSLKKFMKGEVVISVVYDTRDDSYLSEFQSICSRNEVTFYYRKSEPGGSPSFYHAQTANWAYQNIILKEEEDCFGLFLDHDMFLIDEFDVEEEMSDNDIMGCLQSREDVEYIWPGLFFCKKSSVENIEFDFFPQTVDGQMLDTGGGTYKLIRAGLKYEDTGVDYPEEYKGIDLQDNNLTGGFGFEMHYGTSFLHSRNACNWHNNFVVKDSNKSDLLYKMLSDIIDDKNKNYLELVVARYEEDLKWAKNYGDFTTVYNKGESEVEGSIKLKNIGREAHTYLYHIVNNYDNLADYTVFLQGDPAYPHSPRVHKLIKHIIEDNELLPDFFWVSERIVESDFEYIREPYHKLFPNLKFAYETIFGKEPDVETFSFGAGAQFCVSRERLRRQPKEFYKKILDIFEYDKEELDEVALKLLGNPGLNEKFLPLNPELGLHMERLWGFILDEV